MALTWTTEIEDLPIRAVIYGVEGIGKTTFAASWPNALTIDTENGTKRLRIAKKACRGDWPGLKSLVRQFAAEKHDRKTLVIDTIDWAEDALRDYMLKRDGKRSIEEYSYGKGWVKLSEEFCTLLEACDAVIESGRHVVLVAHSQVKKIQLPDQADAIDRYQLKMHQKTSEKVREWCDLLLFANYETKVVETDGGRKRAIGGKTRVLHTERSAAFDAKNRFGLPERIPMTVEALGDVFAPPAPQQPGWLARVQAAATVEELGRIADEAEAATLTPAQRRKLEQAISRRHDEIEPRDDDAQEHHDAADAEAEAIQ